MDHPNLLRVPKWPFMLGDLALFAAAAFICKQSQWPMGHWELVLMALCVAGAALSGLAPFVLEFQAAIKVAEAGALTSVVAQIQQLDSLAVQISGATAQWQGVHEAAGKTATTAREISERMMTEMRGFSEMMERANNSEKATLRLEVEKLRRAEAEWLQVLVRMLDHVYALHQGAIRSGQPNLIEQMGRFQNACCDAARRVGLMPFAATPAEPFDPQRHQVFNGDGKPTPGALVGDTMATGYTYQGQLLRPALVRLRDNGAGSVRASAPAPESEPSPKPLPSGSDSEPASD